MSDIEIAQRRELQAQIDRACGVLNLDGLRFVLCIALLREMTASELDQVVEHLRAECAEKGTTG